MANKAVKVDSVIYKNSPLQEAIFELQFPGEPKIECRRDLFYQAIRNQFPHVLVPPYIEGEHPSLQLYKFETENHQSGLAVAINRFSFYTRNYLGFGSFSSETVKWLTAFGSIYELSRINRCGLRYINIIPYTRENGFVPLSNIFKINFDLPKVYAGEFENLDLTFSKNIDSGAITTKIATIISSDKSHEALLLDFDYSKSEGLNFGDFPSYLEECHRYTKQVFEELITDEYRLYLKGDTV